MVGELTPADVRRWDVDAIRAVFEVVRNQDGTYQRFGESLGSVQQMLLDWNGEAGDAFHQDIHRHRRDIDASGQLSPKLSGAIDGAVADVTAAKNDLANIDADAAANDWVVTESWGIDSSANPKDVAAIQALQDRLSVVRVNANTADQELAAAIHAAVGDIASTALGDPVPRAPGKPESEQGDGESKPSDKPTPASGPTASTKPGAPAGGDTEGPAAPSAAGAQSNATADKPWYQPQPSDIALGLEGAIAGGSHEAVRQTVLSQLEKGPLTGPDAPSPGLLKWFEDPKIRGLRAFSPVSVVTAVPGAIGAVAVDMGVDHNPAYEAIIRETVGTGAGLWAGAVSGAATGAWVGTLVPIPGVGTAAGLVVGAGAGAIASYLGSKGVGALWGPAANAVGSAVHGVKSLFGFG